MPWYCEAIMLEQYNTMIPLGVSQDSIPRLPSQFLVLELYSLQARDCHPALWSHGVQAGSGFQQEGHGAAAAEGLWHRAAESAHACLLGQYHLFLPCLPGLLRSIFHDSVNLALLSVAREVH